MRKSRSTWLLGLLRQTSSQGRQRFLRVSLNSRTLNVNILSLYDLRQVRHFELVIPCAKTSAEKTERCSLQGPVDKGEEHAKSTFKRR